jgi:3-dehydroquinate dehydratase/shikimate dehydrogenase
MLHPARNPAKMRKSIMMSIATQNPSIGDRPSSGPRLRAPRICVAIQAESAAEMTARAEAALADSRFLELRFDSLAQPADALPMVQRFLAAHKDAIAIATCRRKPFGGHFAQSLAEEFAVLQAAAECGCQIVDLEVESAEEAKPAALAKFRESLRAAGAALLISFHDFTRTPALEKAAERIAAFAPDYVKVVSTAQALADNLAMLKLIEERSLSARWWASPWEKKG